MSSNYAFVEPRYIDADNPKNIHIFQASCRDGVATLTSPSLCGQRKLKSPFNVMTKKQGNETKKCFTKEEARTFAAGLQNNNRDVCGQCVADLYADMD